jgi:ATP-dependent helicase/nuclease subunit B
MESNMNGSGRVLTGHTLQELRDEAFSRASSVSEAVPNSVMYLKSDASPSEDIRDSWCKYGTEIRQRIVTMDDIVDTAYDREFIAGRQRYFNRLQHRQIVDAAIHQLPEGHRFFPTTGAVTNGHLRQLQDLLTLTEFAALLTPEDIRERLKEEDLHNLASDLASLKTQFEEFRQKMVEKEGIEMSLRAERYVNTVEGTNFSDIYPNVDVVIIGEFDRFSPVEKRLIEWISEGNNSVYALVPRYSDGHPSGVDRTLSHIWDVYTEQLGFGTKEISTGNSESHQKRSVTGSIHPSVFQTFYRPMQEGSEVESPREDVPIGDLEAVAPMDADHEIRYIVRRIQDLLQDGVDPEEVGVVVTDSGYLEKFSSVADERNLPFSVSLETNLEETFVGSAFLDSLDIIQDPTDAESLIKLLSNPTTEADSIELGEFAVTLSECEIDDLEELAESDEGAEVTEDIDKAEMEFLNKVIKQATTTANSDKAESVFDFLDHFGLEEGRFSDLGTVDTDAWNSIERTVEAVDERLEAIQSDLEWVGALRRASGSVVANSPQGTSARAVDIRSINNSEGVTYNYVFISGLTETQYPSGGNRLAFTRILNEADPDFDRAKPHKRADYTVARLLASAGTAVLSRPRKKEDGTEYVKAGILTELLDRTGIEIEDIDEYSYLADSDRTEIHDAVGSVSDVWRALSVVAEADGRTVEALKNTKHLISEYTEGWSTDDPCSLTVAGIRTAENRDSGKVGLRNGWIEPETFQNLSRKDREPMSPSELNTFAECGFKYYMEYVLDIGEEEEDSSAASRGTIVHEILEEFYSGLQTQNQPVDLSEYESEYVETILLESAIEVLPKEVFDDKNPKEDDSRFEDSTHELSMSWLRELLSGLDNPDGNPMYNPWDLDEPVNGILASFLEEEMTLRGETDGMDEPLSTVPVSFEQFLESSVGSVEVHGFVDRVDMKNNEDGFVVRDYKTGSIPSEKDVLGGIDLQIPLYMSLVDEVNAEMEPIAGTYYAVQAPASVSSYDTVLVSDEDAIWNKSGGGPVRRHNTPEIDRREEIHNFIREVIPNRVEQIKRSISSGYFHPTVNNSDDAGCSYCDFKDICDVRQHRRHEMISSLVENHEDAYIPRKTKNESPVTERDSRDTVEMGGGDS